MHSSIVAVYIIVAVQTDSVLGIKYLYDHIIGGKDKLPRYSTRWKERQQMEFGQP